MTTTTGKLASTILVFLWLCCCAPVQAAWDARRLRAIFNATSRWQALHTARHFAQEDRTERQRLRQLLQQQQNEADSTPLLANASGFDDTPGFYHSVASGDPLPEAVIVWTRYTPLHVDDEIVLELRMLEYDNSTSTNSNMEQQATVDWALAQTATIRVTSATDWIAKVDVQGLTPNTAYAFVFVEAATGVASDVGLTRTAPDDDDDDVDQVTYAVFSCAILWHGVFHAYDVASTVKDLDFWIHAGDFMYEYGTYYDYARTASWRYDSLLPQWETISLQDYRLRYASYIHADEGLRNLRRRAPMLVSSWDDHELVNDVWGDDATQSYGSENHQPVCPVGSTASDSQKDEEKCDRDEGEILTRFQAAAQAYFEWLPIRYTANSTTAVVDLTAVNQVRQWGKLATFMTVDSRATHRTTAGGGLDEDRRFIAFILAFPFPSRYDRIGLAKFLLQRLVNNEVAKRSDPAKTIVGDNMEILRAACRESKLAGKPWQLYVSNTNMGQIVLMDLLKQYKLIKLKELRLRRRVKRFWNILAKRPVKGGAVRLLSALYVSRISGITDDWNGFYNDRSEVLSILEEEANNPIVLSGDLHDAFAMRLNRGGAHTGTPVAVSLVTTSVAAPGLLELGLDLFGDRIQSIVGGRSNYADLYEAGLYEANPSMVFTELENPGFTVMRMTKESHVAEFISIDRTDMLLDYDEARAANGGNITAAFECAGAVKTMADEPGSLDRNGECGATQFSHTRPPVYDVPVPTEDPIAMDNVVEDCGFQQCEVTLT